MPQEEERKHDKTVSVRQTCLNAAAMELVSCPAFVNTLG